MDFPLAKKFVSESSFLLLPVQKPGISERIREEAQRRGFTEKEETHISVAVTKNAKKIADTISEAASPAALRNGIVALFESFAWGYTLVDEYYLQESFYDEARMAESGYAEDQPEHTRRTIVQKADLPDLPVFYQKLNKLLGTALSIPIPHVTLFSWSDNPAFMTRGIGISSEEEFSAYSRGRL